MRKETLSPEAIERICHLNARLLEAANWTEERAKLTHAAYFAGGGMDNFRQRDERDGCWEDYELEAIVKCSLSNDDPAFKPDDEYANIVAATTLSQQPTREDCLAWNDCAHYWDEGLDRFGDFRQTRFCYLFHDLYEHTLWYDLDALLRIGEIEINLVLLRQRCVSLDPALLPRKRKKSYPRSVFSQSPCGTRRDPLTDRGLRYARLLNQKMDEGCAWIDEQIRRSENEYKDIGGPDRRIAEDGAYEDHELMLRVDGFLGEKHPEYDESENNLIVTHSEAVCKKNQYIFGRSRNPLHYDRYGPYFSKGGPLWRQRHPYIGRMRPCGLFWDIFKQADDDWLKMLSIGVLWFEVVCVQRRIAVV